MNTNRYKIFLFIGFLFFLFLSNSNAQSYYNNFAIAPNYYVNDFSIDRLAQQIYIDFYGGRDLKIDLKTGAVDTTRLMGLASYLAFANKHHLMLSNDTLYDLNKGSYFAPIPQDTINNFNWQFVQPYFSPNDSNLMISFYYNITTTDPTTDITNNFIFSLKDSLFIPIDSSVQPRVYTYGNFPQWSSDTSFVFQAGDSAIAEYFIRSRRIDTLVTLHNYNRVVSFTYNAKYNILAYSISKGGIIPNISPLIYFHYKDSTSDFLAFSPVRDDSSCNSFGIALTYLCWSPNNDRLGFFSFDPTNDVTAAYFYSLNTNRSYELSPCNDRSIKYFLQWANEDTLVYLDNTVKRLFGISISKIDEIRKKKDNNLPSYFSLSSYPNPFNPSVTFEITLPREKNAVLSIYNIQGKLIKEYRIKSNGRAKYRIKWNAVNSRGETVASGIYIAVLNSENSKDQIMKTTKIIHLK